MTRIPSLPPSAPVVSTSKPSVAPAGRESTTSPHRSSLQQSTASASDQLTLRFQGAAPTSAPAKNNPFEAANLGIAATPAVEHELENTASSKSFLNGQEWLGQAVEAKDTSGRVHFGQKAARSFCRAVNDFEMPVNQAESYRLAAKSSRLAGKEPGLIDKYVRHAVQHFGAQNSYVESLTTAGHEQKAQQAATLLKGKTRFLGACRLLYSSPQAFDDFMFEHSRQN